MQNEYLAVSIHKYLHSEELTEILKGVINKFDCSGKNKEVDTFLKRNAIEFAKKGQAVTYLVFKKNDASILVGFFSLAVKPIAVSHQMVSNRYARKLARISRLDEKNATYDLSAYLIAQIGKNYAIDESDRISGSELLAMAESKIYEAKMLVGGVAMFLECENDMKLISFYTEANYKYFGTRLAVSNKTGDVTEYSQLIKTI